MIATKWGLTIFIRYGYNKTPIIAAYSCA